MSHSSDQLRETVCVEGNSRRKRNTVAQNRIYEHLECFADILEPKILANLKFALGKFKTVHLKHE